MEGNLHGVLNFVSSRKIVTEHQAVPLLPMGSRASRPFFGADVMRRRGCTFSIHNLSRAFHINMSHTSA